MFSLFLKTALSWDYINSSHIIQHPFKVNKWFLEYSELNNYHHNTILEHFHHPPKKPCEQVYDRHMLSCLWDIFLGVELRDHTVTLYLTFWEPPKLFLKVYFPTKCSVAFCVSIQIFCPFLNWAVFLVLSHKSSLYMLGISPLPDMYKSLTRYIVANTFSNPWIILSLSAWYPLKQRCFQFWPVSFWGNGMF